MSAWEQYKVGSNVPHNSKVYEFKECLSKELRTAATHAFPNILRLDLSR